MSLDLVPLGKRFRVTGIKAQGPLPYRLMEMGFIEGTESRWCGGRRSAIRCNSAWATTSFHCAPARPR